MQQVYDFRTKLEVSKIRQDRDISVLWRVFPLAAIRLRSIPGRRRLQCGLFAILARTRNDPAIGTAEPFLTEHLMVPGVR